MRGADRVVRLLSLLMMFDRRRAADRTDKQSSSYTHMMAIGGEFMRVALTSLHKGVRNDNAIPMRAMTASLGIGVDLGVDLLVLLSASRWASLVTRGCSPCDVLPMARASAAARSFGF